MPGNRNFPCPQWEEINKKREVIPTLIDGGLAPDGIKLSINYKQYEESFEDNNLSIIREERKTIYRFKLSWEMLNLNSPQTGEVLFCNGQVHLHDGNNYQGTFPFSENHDLKSQTKDWCWVYIQE